MRALRCALLSRLYRMVFDITPPLYAAMALFMIQGYCYIGSAAADFHSFRYPSQLKLWIFSASIATLVLWMGESPASEKLRLPLLYLVNGTILLVIILRFHSVVAAEFGELGTWHLHGPGLLLAVMQIGRGVTGGQEAFTGGNDLPELDVTGMSNYVMALGFMVSAGILNITYVVRVGIRLVGRLTDLSIRDPLTGLVNRRGLETEMQAAYQRYIRSGRPFVLISIDIDHFKRVNDTYGHVAGDFVLCQLSKLMSDSIRATDTAARIGGEEFLLLLTDTDLSHAMIIADRLRQQVADLQLSWTDYLIATSISLGVAETLSSAESMESLIQRADAALYKAKLGGRNRIVVAESSVISNDLFASA